MPIAVPALIALGVNPVQAAAYVAESTNHSASNLMGAGTPVPLASALVAGFIAGSMPTLDGLGVPEAVNAYLMTNIP